MNVCVEDVENHCCKDKGRNNEVNPPILTLSMPLDGTDKKTLEKHWKY